MKLSRDQGFSLTEIVIALAIISILTAIGRPMYVKYRARAIQSQAKVELTVGFTYEEAFYASYHTYQGNLCYIGMMPPTITVVAGSASVTPGFRRYYGYFTSGGTLPVNGRANPNIPLSQYAGDPNCFGAAYSATCYPMNVPGGNNQCIANGAYSFPDQWQHNVWGVPAGKQWDAWVIDYNRKISQMRDGL